MDPLLPEPPEFGAPLPVTASPEALRLLALRRSTSAATLQAPGPTAAQLDALLRLAVRVPDHGKLAPWRFILLEGEAKATLEARLREIAALHGHAEGALIKLSAPPMAVVVVSRPTQGKIPVWEQELSAGAVCMNLMVAAHAMGLGANWITDWYSSEPLSLALLGVTASEKVAGFIYLGAQAEPPPERVRPQVEPLMTVWAAP